MAFPSPFNASLQPLILPLWLLQLCMTVEVC